MRIQNDGDWSWLVCFKALSVSETTPQWNICLETSSFVVHCIHCDFVNRPKTLMSACLLPMALRNGIVLNMTTLLPSVVRKWTVFVSFILTLPDGTIAGFKSRVFIGLFICCRIYSAEKSWRLQTCEYTLLLMRSSHICTNVFCLFLSWLMYRAKYSVDRNI